MGENSDCKDICQTEKFVEYQRKMSEQAMDALYQLRENGQLCDAIITLDDGTSFHVHRAILSACSLFFRTMFTTAVAPNDRSTIKLPGINTDIMNQVILYVYKRKLNVAESNVVPLLIAADYLQIESMLRICCDYLQAMINPKICISVMKFAKTYYCLRLFEAAQLYLVRNFTEIVDESNEFLELSPQELVDILKKDDLNVKREESVWETILKWINVDASNRAEHVASLLGTVRLGLLEAKFFNEKIKDHPFVLGSAECQPLVVETSKFLSELETIASRKEALSTPEIARPRIPNEILFAIGGWSGGSPTACIETYDSRADRWNKVAEVDPEGPRAYHGTAVIGHLIYIIGGFDGYEYYNSCRCFNAVTREWHEVAPMNARRSYVSVVVVNDIIYAIGGYDGRFRRNSGEKYDYRENQWSFIEPMSVPRSDANACVLDNKIYVTGGFNGYECLYSVEVYDTQTNQWSAIKDMRSRRSGVSCIAMEDNVYAIGGFNGIARMSSGEKYDPYTNKWYPISEMFNSRSNFALAVVDDVLFAIGGFNGINTIYNVECYDTKLNEWFEATDMSIYRSALSACVLAGLPNVQDYAHKHRENLLEEKRQQIIAANNRRPARVAEAPRLNTENADFYSNLMQPYFFRVNFNDPFESIQQLSRDYFDFISRNRRNRRPALENDETESTTDDNLENENGHMEGN